MTTKKTLKTSKIYIQYLDEKGDKFTLSFRDEKRMKDHLDKNKIRKMQIKYQSSKRPSNTNVSVSQISSPRMYAGFGNTSKRGVANG